MEKVFVAQGVATKLFATENSVDAALTQATTLLAGLLEARQEMNLSATAGNDVVVKVTEAISALTSARTAMVEAHDELADLKTRVGIRATMIGFQEKPPQAAYTGPTVVSKAG